MMGRGPDETSPKNSKHTQIQSWRCKQQAMLQMEGRGKMESREEV